MLPAAMPPSSIFYPSSSTPLPQASRLTPRPCYNNQHGPERGDTPHGLIRPAGARGAGFGAPTGCAHAADDARRVHWPATLSRRGEVAAEDARSRPARLGDFLWSTGDRKNVAG